MIKQEILTKPKKIILNYAFIFALAILFFLFGTVHQVKATEIDQQQVGGSTDFYWSFTVGFPYQVFQPVNNTLNIFSFEMLRNRNIAPENWHIYLRLCRLDTATSTFSRYCNTNGNTLIYGKDFDEWWVNDHILLNTYAWVDFPTDPITVDPNYKYLVMLDGSSGVMNSYRNRYNTDQNSYTRGYAGNLTGQLSGDLNFIVYGYVPALAIKTPLQGVAYADFPNWQIRYNLTATTSTTTLHVLYGQDPNNLIYDDPEVVPGQPDTVWAVQKNRTLSDGWWYVQAKIEQNGTTTATTSQIKFLIDNANGTTNFLGGMAFSNIKQQYTFDPCAGVDTGTISGSIECAFKKVVAWAFIPNNDLVDEIKTETNTTKTKPPFSAFFSITDTVNQAIASTTIQNESFRVPMINATSTGYHMVSVVNSSTLASVVGSSNSTLIRNSIGWFAWIITIAIIFFTIR